MATIRTFYILLTGYSIADAYFAGTDSIPLDTATFFKLIFLKDSGSLGIFGPFSWPVFLSITIVCAISRFVLARNIRSGAEKIGSIFLPILCAIILFFAGVVSLLFEARLCSGTFSSSLGLGIVTAYST